MRYWLGLLTLCWVLTAAAVEVAGVEIPDQTELETGEQLQLNGAGVRKKFFVKVYVGALYLPARTTDARAVLTMDGPRQILMHFIYDGVSREKITDGWNEGFSANLDEASYAAVADRLQQFNAYFRDAAKDDRIELSYLPGTGTRVRINGAPQGVVEGEDFARALFSVWLGTAPADADLKEKMLGHE